MTTEQDLNLALPTIANQPASAKLKRVPSLRRRLLVSILPAVLIPFVLASAIGYIITERRAREQIVDQLEAEAVTASSTIASFIRNSLQTVNLIAVDPEAVGVIKAGNELSREQNLARESITALEERFAANKLLSVNNNLNNYLRQLIRSEQIAEVFLTEANGFNVAYSNPTSDFVQRDESWWQTTRQQGIAIDEPGFDASANTTVIPFSQAVRDPQSQEFIGVVRAAIPITTLIADLANNFDNEHHSSQLQIIDLDESFVVYSSNQEEMEITGEIDDDDEDEDEDNSESIALVGGEAILEAIETLLRVEGNSLSYEAMEEAEELQTTTVTLEEAKKLIAEIPGFSNVILHKEEIYSEISTNASFKYEDKIYTISTVPNTDLISIGKIDYEVVTAAARNLLLVFALIATVLGAVAVGLIILLARQISRPLESLSTVTQQAAAGNLDAEAEPKGTLETRVLANNFNYLIRQTKTSVQEQQALTEQQRQEKEQLELAIYTLIDEIGDATDGDLTVRANLDNLELSTIADLFNAIIDNLQEIAVEARQSSNLVGSSLKRNEEAIRTLAQQATTEAKETRDTLKSVAQMSQSIKAVAANASEVEKIADDTYNTVLSSTNNMDSTVNSILNLRTTVNNTANKMQRLTESSQKISQAVSLIEEIALKTNVLAINAGAEAERAGEYGQGFSVVAEQVGALAEQSKTAIKEIAGIVSGIQAETQDVKQAMESGTAEVLNTSRLVENTKQSLAEVLEKSQTINQLMESISQSTVSQADTSQSLTSLMQKIAELSASTSKSSAEVAQSIGETALVAEKLKSAVSQFKVTK